MVSQREQPEGRYPEDRYHYTREFFDPKPPAKPERTIALRGGDRPKDSPYVYDEEIILAVNTALAARRPLLVGGPPGTGKSALAEDIADQLDTTCLRKVITGRTEGRDLLWRFDTVRRLRDAHLAAVKAAEGEMLPDLDKHGYLDKGVLWEAFDASQKDVRKVVLIDEIDKADPDVPNSLLEVLGNGEFRVDETGEWVKVNDKHHPFILITTNDERELSRPFRRRCVTLTLEPPNKDRLLAIATAWGLTDGTDRTTADALADEILRLAGPDGPAELTANAAEYLDALRACLKLGVAPGSPAWQAIIGATLDKRLGDGQGTT